jgi:hypothetical protein
VVVVVVVVVVVTEAVSSPRQRAGPCWPPVLVRAEAVEAAEDTAASGASSLSSFFHLPGLAADAKEDENTGEGHAGTRRASELVDDNTGDGRVSTLVR